MQRSSQDGIYVDEGVPKWLSHFTLRAGFPKSIKGVNTVIRRYESPIFNENVVIISNVPQEVSDVG